MAVKLLHIFLFLLPVTFLSQQRGFPFAYEEQAKAAGECMKNKEYACAVEKYKAAFQTLKGRGRVEDFYNVAASYARLQEKDSAFRWLEIIVVKNSFRDYKKLSRDNNFKSLRGEARWDTLLAKVKQNKESFEKKAEEFNSKVNEAKSRQKELAGKAAPAIVCTDIDGNNFETEKLKGKVIVLNFWATWCGPCRKEIPSLNEMREEFRGKDVVFLSFCTDIDSIPVMKNALQRLPVNYNVVISPQARAAGKSYFVSAYPLNIVIDKEGTVIFLEDGYADWVVEEMKGKIEECLKQK